MNIAVFVIILGISMCRSNPLGEHTWFHNSTRGWCYDDGW